MDLHDYKDVAENYDRYLEVMYEVEDNYEGFIDFYYDLAKKYGDKGVIDIACGTGAVILELAKRGIDCDGSDISEEMCNVALDKASKLGLNLNIFPADMTKMNSDKKYSLAIIARSGFMHLCSQEQEIEALMNIREHLVDGGILSLNTFDPAPFIQAQQMQNSIDDYHFRLEYINAEGNREKIYNAISYEPVSQIMSGNWKFETLDNDGNVIGERIRPLKMRQIYRSEMYLLAKLCGFEVIGLYKDYLGNKADEGWLNRLIWVLKKK